MAHRRRDSTTLAAQLVRMFDLRGRASRLFNWFDQFSPLPASTHGGNRPLGNGKPIPIGRCPYRTFIQWRLFFGIRVFHTIASQLHFPCRQVLEPGSPVRHIVVNIVFLQSGKRFLTSERERQCLRPMVRMKPVTRSADGGEGATPCC